MADVAVSERERLYYALAVIDNASDGDVIPEWLYGLIEGLVERHLKFQGTIKSRDMARQIVCAELARIGEVI